MTTGIYMITNKINGKKYIGQSVNIERRWYDHKYKAFYKDEISFDSPIHQAFRKYGTENFDFTILTECSVEELDKKEIDLISEYQSLYPNGYNIMIGGQEYRTEQNFCIKCGKRILKNSTYCEECWGKIQRLQERPSKEWLAEQIYLRGFVDVGREFEVSDNAIRAWCKSYGLPFHIEELKNWWREYANLEKPKPKKVNLKGQIAQINKETLEIIEVFENGADVERKYPQYLAKTINRACTGNLKTAYGFIWKRLNKE